MSVWFTVRQLLTNLYMLRWLWLVSVSRFPGGRLVSFLLCWHQSEEGSRHLAVTETQHLNYHHPLFMAIVVWTFRFSCCTHQRRHHKVPHVNQVSVDQTEPTLSAISVKSLLAQISWGVFECLETGHCCWCLKNRDSLTLDKGWWFCCFTCCVYHDKSQMKHVLITFWLQGACEVDSRRCLSRSLLLKGCQFALLSHSDDRRGKYGFILYEPTYFCRRRCANALFREGNSAGRHGR